MEKSIGRLVSILHRQSQIYVNYALKEFHITSAEYAFLMYLYRNEGVTQDELSSYLYIDKSATTRAVKSLEKKGFVIKNKDDSDKRFNRIYLSEKAKNYKDKIRKKIWYWSEFLTNDMDQDTIDLVICSLEKMVNKVEETNIKLNTEDS